jgi:NADH-quinone oxidoreductase subunit C
MLKPQLTSHRLVAKEIEKVIQNASLKGIQNLIEKKDMLEITCDRANFLEIMSFFYKSSALKFSMLLSVTAVDWLDSKDVRFEVIYHLLSIENQAKIRIKVLVSEDDAWVPSLCSIWLSANFMERETWDMYGIEFKDHPNLERVLLYKEFVGHPLRKDYPVQGKQPRIPLRHPEVTNTAPDLRRSELVQVRRGV